MEERKGEEKTKKRESKVGVRYRSVTGAEEGQRKEGELEIQVEVGPGNWKGDWWQRKQGGKARKTALERIGQGRQERGERKKEEWH